MKMDYSIKLSVIVPIYNVEEYLDECLLSLKKQTLQNIEVLMIDDGSTDYSAEIAKRYEKENNNFHYFYKENGGLGNARNFAIPFVKGEYLTFMDSDDIIPEDAYEKMYNLAIKTGNDMISGNVKRFNSTKVYDSALHVKIFDNAYDHTHILQNPNLVYDTISCNKMFKTSFFKNNGFKFPEKILYEDIPVTIPAHFMANSVGMVTDVCYLWRARDGVSKSITQNRLEIKNLTDRTKIMDMVNVFYKNNVTDYQALLMKDYKWLDVDLKLYINELLDATDEYRQIALEEINRHLDDIVPEAFEMLRCIDKIKYFYVKNNDLKSLLELLQYQKTTYKSLSIKKTENDYIGDFPMSNIPNSFKIMTKELEFYPIIQAVEKIVIKDAKITIGCSFYIPRLKKQSEFHVEAKLYNSLTKESVAITIERRNSKYLTSKGGYRFNRKPLKIVKYNYSTCAYLITIDLTNEKIVDFLKNRSFISISYSNEILCKDFILGKSNQYSLNLTQSYHFENGLIKTELINNSNLQVFYDKNICFIDSVDIDNNKVVVNDLENQFMIFNNHNVIYSSSVMNNQICDIEDLKNETYYFYINQDEKIALSLSYNKKIVYQSENHCIFVENDKNGLLKISKYQSKAIIKKIKVVDKSLYVTVEVNAYTQNNIPKLMIENSKFDYKVFYEACDISKSSSSISLQFQINFENQEDIKNISLGDYEFSLSDNGNQSYKLYTSMQLISKVIKIPKRQIMFEVYDNQLYMNVKHYWKKYENSFKKRRIIRKYIYPLLRKLPIKQKYVVFEGWWGNKYHCNPRYLYEYIDRNHKDYKCIWFFNDDYLPITGDGIRVRRKSLRYYYYLAVSKYFVNNVNFHEDYEKRKGQIEIQTMHGTPLKTLGLDVPGEFDDPIELEKFVRKCNRWDYLVVQSNKASEITSSCYNFKKTFLRTGYPRNDILFEKNNSDSIKLIKEKLGIPVNKKVIMYAPTWRKRNHFEMKLDVDDMKKSLGDEYILILRVHPFAYPGFDARILNDFVYNFSTYESVEELYLVSDIVITDYSSVMFDYTILNRPILFFTYDLSAYRDYLRGFNFDFENEAPGPLLESYNQVKEAIINIENISQEYDDALQKFRDKFNEYEKGNASQQIFDIVFDKKNK